MELTKLYLAIPYSRMEESSYTQATEMTSKIINSGDYNVFSPITHSHPLTKYGVKGSWEYWQHIDYQFIDWADEVWVLIPTEGYEAVKKSTGVQAELLYCQERGKPLKYVRATKEGYEFVDPKELPNGEAAC